MLETANIESCFMNWSHDAVSLWVFYELRQFWMCSIKSSVSNQNESSSKEDKAVDQEMKN